MKIQQSSQKPVWLKKSQEEIEKIIFELADKGMSIEKIGLLLRDQYGIPSTKIYGKKISQIIENKIKSKPNTDVDNINKRVEKIKKHILKNPRDERAHLYITIHKEKAKKLAKHGKK